MFSKQPRLTKSVNYLSHPRRLSSIFQSNAEKYHLISNVQVSTPYDLLEKNPLKVDPVALLIYEKIIFATNAVHIDLQLGCLSVFF